MESGKSRKVIGERDKEAGRRGREAIAPGRSWARDYCGRRDGITDHGGLSGRNETKLETAD